ncbi:MAG: glycosyltransferase family 39 protein, partial [Hyphomicrobiaceae bacterium]
MNAGGAASAAERPASAPVAGPAGRDTERRRGLLMVLAGVLLYIVLHAGFRLLASSTLGEDDTLDQILVQDLRVGYDPRQPPLYDWLLWLVQQVTGPRLVSFLAIKYAALAATAVLLYLVAFRVLRDRLWAVLTVESLALIYQISWRYHEGFTHQVLAMVAVAATLWAVLRLIDRGRTSDFILLGFICGLSFLTEPAYAVYLASLLAAAF